MSAMVSQIGVAIIYSTALFRRRSKKTSKLRVTGLYEGKSQVNSPHKGPGGRLNKKDGLTRYGNSHVKDKTS